MLTQILALLLCPNYFMLMMRWPPKPFPGVRTSYSLQVMRAETCSTLRRITTYHYKGGRLEVSLLCYDQRNLLPVRWLKAEGHKPKYWLANLSLRPKASRFSRLLVGAIKRSSLIKKCLLQTGHFSLTLLSRRNE